MELSRDEHKILRLIFLDQEERMRSRGVLVASPTIEPMQVHDCAMMRALIRHYKRELAYELGLLRLIRSITVHHCEDSGEPVALAETVAAVNIAEQFWCSLTATELATIYKAFEQRLGVSPS